MDTLAEQPSVTIPASPEIPFGGIDAAITPTIMKCCLGGWLISVPGKGIAAKTTLSEAIEFLEDHSFEFFGERRRDFPKFTMPVDEAEEVEIKPRRFTRAVQGFFSFLGARVG